MPFLILGIIMIGVGIAFYRSAKRDRDKEGVVGMVALIIAGVIMLVFYGIFYRLLL